MAEVERDFIQNLVEIIVLYNHFYKCEQAKASHTTMQISKEA